MAVSDKDEPVSRGDDYQNSQSRYDLVLTVIPAAFLIAGLTSAVLSVEPRTMLVAASLIGTLALVDALFVNPPRA